MIIFLASIWGFGGCSGEAPVPSHFSPASSSQAPPQAPKVREAAVAGLFYPRNPEELSRLVSRLIEESQPREPLPGLKALICPHAGYRFSGSVAARAYALLAGQRFSQVVVLAPAHYAAFAGASVAVVHEFETPLGRIPVSPLAAKLASKAPFFVDRPGAVRRPEWAEHSGLRVPRGEDTPHTWEHSLEVQLPFLQHVLGTFSLVPIVLGEVEPAEVARGLAPYLEDETLVIASTDLSHYYPQSTANRLDKECIEAICRLDDEGLSRAEACGRGPIRVVVHLAKQFGWQSKLLDYRTSGDTYGDYSAVVGYTAIAFYRVAEDVAEKPNDAEASSDATRQESPNASSRFESLPALEGGVSLVRASETQAAASSPQERTCEADFVGEARSSRASEVLELSESDKKLLLYLARKAIEAAVLHQSLPEIVSEKIPEQLKEPWACFVTLTQHGQLRGCIGTIYPQEPLFEAVLRRARSAALEDPRFPPLQPSELGEVEIEISVLSRPRRLQFNRPEELLQLMRPGRDGVVLKVGQHQATFLPQVWEKIPKPEQFLSRLAEKAGLPPQAWQSPEAAVYVYVVEAFEETKPKGAL